MAIQRLDCFFRVKQESLAWTTICIRNEHWLRLIWDQDNLKANTPSERRYWKIIKKSGSWQNAYFLIHKPETASNAAVIEIKLASNNRKGLQQDLNKLALLRRLLEKLASMTQRIVQLVGQPNHDSNNYRCQDAQHYGKRLHLSLMRWRFPFWGRQEWTQQITEQGYGTNGSTHHHDRNDNCLLHTGEKFLRTMRSSQNKFIKRLIICNKRKSCTAIKLVRPELGKSAILQLQTEIGDVGKTSKISRGYFSTNPLAWRNLVRRKWQQMSFCITNPQ